VSGAVEVLASSSGSTGTGTTDAAGSAAALAAASLSGTEVFDGADAFVAEAEVELDLVAVFAEFGAASSKGKKALCYSTSARLHYSLGYALRLSCVTRHARHW
jgi:hypothetical protein